MHILYQWIGDGSQRIRENYSASESRSLHMTGAAGALCMLLGLGKIIFGALSLSVFTCINGCYTLGMTAARYCALAGTVHSKERKKQYCYYRLAGAVMVAASLLYVVYSLWIRKLSIMVKSRQSPLQRSHLRKSASMYGA